MAVNISLKPTTKQDLETLFHFQAEVAGMHMAAFTAKDQQDREAYLKRWSQIIEKPSVNMQTIIVEGEIVGSIIHFDMEDETHVSYWIGQAYWGKGYASDALRMFTQSVSKRPLHAWVAFDNLGSQKVLERAGFTKTGTETNFANARAKEIEEFIYQLG